jgi:threonylcarbamoyladenosine tRNA methylthiotransferase MtaB
MIFTSYEILYILTYFTIYDSVYKKKSQEGRAKVIKSKKVAVYNLGCKVNSYEALAMEENLENNGYQIVDFTEVADVYIVNTCTVTNIASSKSRQMLSRARKANTEAIIVAVGCYVHVMDQEKAREQGIDVLIGNNKKQDLVEILEDVHSNLPSRSNCEEKNENKEKSKDIGIDSSKDKSEDSRGVTRVGFLKKEIIDINQTKIYESLSRSKARSQTRVSIKIQDGCNQFCSYCIVPIVRGRARSRPLKEVLKEAKALSENGCMEVVITGINLSSYGEDLENITILDVIKGIHKVSGITRIRLGSLEPRIITKEFVKALSTLEKFCPHFHLSLQSGCDRILKDMNSHYTTKEYYEKCQLIRKYFKHPSITTDIIVGFPGETADDFAATISFVDKVGFHEIHVFKYSRREGTRAATLPDQVTNKEKAIRSEALIEIGKVQKKAFERYYLGREVEVLVEGEMKVKGKNVQVGYNKEYVKVVVNSDKELQNQLISINIIEETQFVH